VANGEFPENRFLLELEIEKSPKNSCAYVGNGNA
jgi:hypothetical protein